MEVYTATYDADLTERAPVRAEVVDEATFAEALAAGT
ncbi:MAG: tRNA (adenosine(37)-N6)-threonylcarbamoyltransferase complex dimerization subunit type 1 TsaB, partial [Bacteroidetes bacterium]